MNTNANTTTQRTPEQLKELQRRQTVFTKEPETVLVKILAMGVIPGVPKKDRDNTGIEIKHIVEADRRGLDPYAIRENRADTGFQLFNKEEGVRVKLLIENLRGRGFQLTGLFWQDQNAKGPTTTLQFTKGGTEIRMPDELRRLLWNARFNHCTVWCNLREGDSGKQFRLDTVNIAKGRMTNEPSRHLMVDGNTYKLVSPKA